MSYMTKLEGVPDRDDLYPGMAHFHSTGPDGTTCGKCKHRGYYRQSTKPSHNKKTGKEEYKTYRTMSCAMFKKLMGCHGPTIKGHYPSCRYFEAKNEDR